MCDSCNALKLRVQELEKELSVPILVNTVRLLEARAKLLDLCNLYATQYNELYLIAKRQARISPLIKRHIDEREFLLKQVCLDSKSLKDKKLSWKEPNSFAEVNFVQKENLNDQERK